MNKESDFSSNPQPGVSKVEIRLCLITYMYNIYTKCYTRYCQNWFYKYELPTKGNIYI